MVKKRVMVNLILGVILMFGLMGVASAALSTSFVTPAGVIVTGSSAILNVTVTGMDDGLDNVTNVSWYYSTDSGTSWTQFLSENVTADDNVTLLNATFDSTAISDSPDIDFNVTVVGYNGSFTQTVIQGMRLDNTAPSTASCAITSQKVSSTNSVVKIDPSDSADTADTAPDVNVTLWLAGGNQVAENNYQVNDTTTEMTLSLTQQSGQRIVSCAVYDELLQVTHADNQTLTFTSGDGGEETFTIIQEQKAKKSKTMPSLAVMFTILGGAAVILIGMGMGMTGKGRKKRR